MRRNAHVIETIVFVLPDAYIFHQCCDSRYCAQIIENAPREIQEIQAYLNLVNVLQHAAKDNKMV